MNLGISTSCLYPEKTEESFRILAEAGVKTTEIFFNSKSELFGDIFHYIMDLKNEYDIDIVSMHPFASFAEGYYFFGEYERLFWDTLEDYKRIFEREAKFGAKYHVMHGCKETTVLTPEFYAERFSEISKAAKEQGVILAHENVVYFHPGKPWFMKAVSDLVGDDFRMVLDVKQARRAGVDYNEFIDLLGEKIVHLHVSDYSCDYDCTVPNENGLMNFKKLFSRLEEINYKGDAVIEVYRKSFKKPDELIRGLNYLKSL